MPIWRNPPNVPASPQKRGEREGGGAKGKEEQKKRGEREGKTPEQKNKSDRRGKVGISRLAAAEGKIQKQISNDPGRLLPICFDIPSPAQLVERRLRMIPALKTLKSINNAEGAETTRPGV